MTKNENTSTNKVRLNKAPTDGSHVNKGRLQRHSETVNKNEKVNHNNKKGSARVYGTKKKTLEPIRKIEWPDHSCEKCGEPITDLTQALSDKNTGKPVHFECILKFLKNSEVLKEKEEVVYIGNGNFAVVYFENPKVRSKFKIVKLIEWEDRSKIYEWRNQVAELGSHT